MNIVLLLKYLALISVGVLITVFTASFVNGRVERKDLNNRVKKVEEENKQSEKKLQQIKQIKESIVVIDRRVEKIKEEKQKPVEKDTEKFFKDRGV